MIGNHGTAVTQDLVEMGSRRYVFLEHSLPPSSGSFLVSVGADDLRSFIVIRGQVEVRPLDGEAAGTAEYSYLHGWHAWGTAFTMVSISRETAIVLEAGVDGVSPGSCFPARLSPLSDYTVDKPWGHEIWYTENGDRVPYALKQIHMTAGRRSSLQSHRFKAETNYVVDGRVTVLNGTYAPADGEAVDAAAIPRQALGQLTSWTSAPGMLHRVIAETDYTSIEVSTPELDDVIRWADDTARGNGRIAAEHGQISAERGRVAAEHARGLR
jgi:hypothetical protein